jgi:hypothetical protein
MWNAPGMRHQAFTPESVRPGAVRPPGAGHGSKFCPVHDTMTAMLRQLRFLAVPVLVLAAGGSLGAHHSTAAYENTTVTVKGAVIRRLAWANPHSIVSFEVKDTRGRLTTWAVESGSPSALSRTGWNRNSVKAGDVVTIEFFPAKNGAHVARLARIVFADGRELLDSVYKASPFDTIQKK